MRAFGWLGGRGRGDGDEWELAHGDELVRMLVRLRKGDGRAGWGYSGRRMRRIGGGRLGWGGRRRGRVMS